MNRLRINAVRESAMLGLILQDEHPEITDMFNEGNSARNISRLLEISIKYNESFSVSNAAVRFCLKGYCGKFGIDAYEGLLNIKEYLEQIKIQRKNLSIEYGKKSLIEKTGIFGMNEEEILKNRIEAGKRASELKKGIHGLTYEQKIKYCSYSGKNSALKRGFVPWSDDQIEMVRSLVCCGYKNSEIALRINEKHFKGENIRDRDSVYNLRRRLK